MPVRWGVAALAALLPLGLALWARRGRRGPVMVGALAAVVGGGLWLRAWLPNPDAALGSGWGLIVAAGLVALAAAGLLALPSRTRLWPAGVGLAMFGAVLIAESVLAMAWFEWWPAWAGLLLGVMAHGLGLALFGLAALRQRTWGRLGLVPLVAGLLGGLLPLPLSGLVGESSPFPVWLLAFGLGGGWVLLGGLVVWQSRPARARAPQPRTRLG